MNAAVKMRVHSADHTQVVSSLLFLLGSEGAGAIHSAAHLKSINAKHLSLVTQCLGMVIALVPYIRSSLAAQMPSKQHTLLSVFDGIKKEYFDHNEQVLNKFVTIIGGIVEHGLSPKIAGTDFDARAQGSSPQTEHSELSCCVFLDEVAKNTRKMNQVLRTLLSADQLQDVFSRIFAYLDQKIPSLLLSAAETIPDRSKPQEAHPSFALPKTDEGKKRLLLELEMMATTLNGLEGVQPWEFTAVHVLERRLDYRLDKSGESPVGVVNEVDHSDGTTAVEAEVNVKNVDAHDGIDSVWSEGPNRVNNDDCVTAGTSQQEGDASADNGTVGMAEKLREEGDSTLQSESMLDLQHSMEATTVQAISASHEESRHLAGDAVEA
jgi:Vps54-like protein